MKQLILAAAIALTGVSASALEFGTSVGPETGRKYITAVGPIVQGDAFKLQLYTSMFPDHDWIALSSPGGVATEGYDLGSVISELGLNTYVPYGAACVSACYIAFLGGKEYDIDGAIAAHNAYVTGGADITINEAINQGQQFGAYDTWYHLANGFNFSLPYAITAHTDKETFVVFTHEDELGEFFVRSETDTITEYLSLVDTGDAWVVAHVHNGEYIPTLALRNLDNDRPDAFDPRND